MTLPYHLFARAAVATASCGAFARADDAPKERLAAFGYRVLEAPSPVQREQVRGKYLRETFEDSGCCGSLELLKLRAYELVEQRVITGYCAALGLGMPAHVLLSYPSKQTMF